MDSNEPLDQELIDVLKNIAREGCELESLVSDLNFEFDNLYGPNKGQQYSSVNAKYSTVVGKLDKVLRQCQNALNTVENKSIAPQPMPIETIESPDSDAPPPPPKDPPLHIHRPHHMFELFQSRELPVCDSPYPPLCGNIPPDENERIPIDAFVASKLEADYVLCYIAGYSGDDYMICDADADDPKPIRKNKHELIQLPTSLPRVKSSKLEYSVGSTVLSLWPMGEDEWTSVFYPAIVSQIPSRRGKWYNLKFENDGTYETVEVPENFVIPMPKDT